MSACLHFSSDFTKILAMIQLYNVGHTSNCAEFSKLSIVSFCDGVIR